VRFRAQLVGEGAYTQRYMHATANDLKEAMSKLKK